jgi:simple sugar transport system permease protein
MALVAMAIISAIRRQWTPFVATLILAAAGFIAYAMADKPNNQVVYVMPYVVTLIVVAVGGQRLRPPAQAGIPWRKGMQL